MRLAEVAGLVLAPERLRVLIRLNDFSQEGRYPESLGPPVSAAEARVFVEEAREVLTWLMSAS